ncbi:TetR family transcriptional regulator C-terminal domain-containing protein [Streptomyces sp. NBC_00366]
MPLDAARADETAVWLEFALPARTDPALGSIADELHDGLRTVADRLLDRLSVQAPLATEHLAAVLDGLVLNAALHTDRLQPDTLRAVLRRRHLARSYLRPHNPSRHPRRGWRALPRLPRR